MTDTVRVSAYTEAMGEAGDAYIRSVAFDGRYHLPAQFRWHELLSAMLAASPQGEGSSGDADTHRAAERAVQVFLDCDGVLADFDEAGRLLWGESPRAYEARVGSSRFWQELEDQGDFYRTLPLMPDAMALYEGVAHLNPIILTGCPRGNWAEAQKVDWAARHFPGVQIITCRSSDKRAHAKPGDVLIDDWHQHRHRWVEMGGVWISHTCAETSLAALWAYYPHLRADAQPGMSEANAPYRVTEGVKP